MRCYFIIRLIAFALALGVALPSPGGLAQEARLVRMGTGGLAGVYFPVGVALCRLVNEGRRSHGIRCAAAPSEGSLANIDALRAGEAELAIVQSDVQAGAVDGPPPFEGLRALLSLHAEPLTVVARPDAGIAGLEDLAGRRVSYGLKGSGQREIWDVVAGRMGWTEASFEAALELAPGDQADALCDDRIDAFALVVGHPALAVQEATTTCDAVLVPVEGEVIAALVAAVPYYFETTIPGGLYLGNPDPVATFGVGATLVTTADMPEDVVYTIVRSVFDNIEALRGLNPALTNLEPDEMVHQGLTAPLHDGAARYYAEQGWND